MKHQCPGLEWHVTHQCNLRCDNCAHFSNYGLAGTTDLQQTAQQWALWSPRLQPAQFALLGGEPTLHPQLPELVLLARQHWPDSLLLLVSNGWFLQRHPTLPAVLQQTGCLLHISIHHAGPEYSQRLQPIQQLVQDWLQHYQFQVKFRPSYGSWRRSFKKWGQHMEPYRDGDPQTSWQNCNSKWCMQLHQGQLYKCPQLAYINLLHQRVGLSPAWDEFRSYQPLPADCSDQQLQQFLARRAEPLCGHCPAQPEPIRIGSPLPSGLPRI